MALATFTIAAVLALATGQTYFLNCGSADDHTRFVTRPGDTENRVAAGAPIRGATSQYLYQNHRTTRGSATSFTYTFPRRFPGSYLIEFAFAEIADPTNTARCAVGARRFNVAVQGRRVLTNFDVFAKAGCRRATKERFTTTVGSDGRLQFTFSAGNAGRPMVSYIKAVPTTPPPTTTTTQATCRGAGLIRRKEVTSMTNTEWNNYVRAVQAMRQRSRGGRSVYDWYVNVHSVNARHFESGFLPWHRAMLFHWDLDLHAGVPGVRQPYFDWSRSSGNVFGSSVFGTGRYGGTSNNGAFRGFGITRAFQARQLASVAAVAALVRIGNPSTFYNDLESEHGGFHVAVGGNMGLLSQAPNDPLFYAHHAFIDHIWETWMQRTNVRTVGNIGGQQMAPWGDTVNTVMGEFTRCVTYEGRSAGNMLAADSASVDCDSERQAADDRYEAAELFGTPADRLSVFNSTIYEALEELCPTTITTEPPTTTIAPTVTSLTTEATVEIPTTPSLTTGAPPITTAEIITATTAIEAEASTTEAEVEITTTTPLTIGAPLSTTSEITTTAP